MSYFWNTPVNWNFTQNMQLAIEADNNQKYKEIAKEFLEKYNTSISSGIYAIDYCYNTDSLISLHIHQKNTHHLFELVGYIALKNKLNEISINIIKYHDMVYTSQPLAKNEVLITMYGKAEINSINYNTMSTFIIRISGTTCKIINQILEIFIP